jgi:hypothetical protein
MRRNRTEKMTPEINLVVGILSNMTRFFRKRRKGLLTSPGYNPHNRALEYLPRA